MARGVKCWQCRTNVLMHALLTVEAGILDRAMLIRFVEDFINARDVDHMNEVRDLFTCNAHQNTNVN